MKKFTFAAIMALAIVVLAASCGKSTSSNSKLKTDVDTLSYALGMLHTQGLKQYLLQMDLDTAYMDEFIKGMKESANVGDNKKKNAYYLGIVIGQQVSSRMVKGINHEIYGNDSTKTIPLNSYLAGFVKSLKGEKTMFTMEQAGEFAQNKMQAIKARNAAKEYGANKAIGEKFLAANAKKPGVKTMPSGLQYKVIKEGNGPIPSDTSMVKVKYEGKFVDGNVFDASKEAVPMRVNQVIKGFTEALVHMPVGSVWEVYIPQELAYGDRESGPIKPFSALIFKIELVGLGQ